ncbi:Fe2+-dependent dioxygenase [Ectothiorhodospiraceae bacterium 2226]|nr:Fe2+-dependent dioxygenase [Ectothiorhodospiraceae bacterium 2226]
MLVTIPEVLDAARLARVQELLRGADFVDGRLSAGSAARRVKQNEELASDRRTLEPLNNLVMGALVQHPLYQSAVLPLRVAAPFYARYQPGMTYGDHIDDPVMGPVGQRYRSDVAITVFLNAPEEYEGGELLIHTSFGAQRVKLPAGHAVTYPASSLHQVTPVVRGTRLVAVTWAQSMIRDPARREVLFGLSQARDTLLHERPEAEETKRVDIAYGNLVRMWADV